MIEIPLDRLEKSTLSAVIEEFVLREGTDYGPSETSLKQNRTGQNAAASRRRRYYLRSCN